MQHFCNLCGVRFGTDYRPQVPDHLKRLNWQQEIRAIKSEQGRISPFLTGVGYLMGSVLVVSNKSTATYYDPEPGLVRYNLNYSNYQNPRIFAFHNSCWQILLSRTSLWTSLPKKQQRLVECLFDILYCLPYNSRYNVLPAHDFGGATQFWSNDPNQIYSLPFLSADPDTLSLSASTEPLDQAVEFDVKPANPRNDCFSKLSNEMIYLLTTFLQTPDLCCLRLTSKVVAHVTRTRNLPQMFWASRFSTGNEMDFSPFNPDLDMPFKAGTDWRGLYFDMKHTLKDTGLTGHVRNRRRIWECVGHITCTLVPMLHQKPALRNEMEILHELETNDYHFDQIARVYLEECHWPGGPWFGCQYLFFRPEGFENQPLQLSVSRITYNCTKYISGMRICSQNGKRSKTELSRVGFIIPNSETHVPLRADQQMTGIRVAISNGGIVGLEFWFGNKAGQIFRAIVGKMDVLKSSNGSRTASLESHNGRQLFGVLVSIDVCKFTAIMLLERA